MINKIFTTAALAVALMGCSAFDTDGSNNSFFNNGADINNVPTSGKLADDAEMAGMKELAVTADDLSKMMQLGVPSGFDRISNITNLSSDFSFRAAFQAGLANCDFLTRTDVNEQNTVRKAYWIKGSEYCDFQMTGSYYSQNNRFGRNTTRSEIEENMSFERVEGSDNPVVSLELSLVNLRETSGQRGVGETRVMSAQSRLVLTATLADGRTFELRVQSDDSETRTQIADDTRYDNVFRTKNFKAAAIMPDSNMVYDWMKQMQTDQKDIEILKINGLVVATEQLN